jgi:ABC-type bacteriocin/lantibiotic exporter with double-glycine peptidase domain
VSSLTAVAILGVGALQVVDGTLTIGTLIAFQSLLMSFSAPIQRMVGVAAKVQQASADLARLDDVLHYRRDWRFPATSTAAVATPAAGRLSMRDVSFGYSPLEAPLIENFSLDVAPGQWVALVGESGSGKSTIGKLITGLYEPRAGEVRIDGHTLADWGRERLSHIVASVDQDIRLFQGTVRDNVTLWDDTIPMPGWSRRSTMQASPRPSRACRAISTGRSRRPGAISTAASASASKSRAPWCRNRRCWCSTRRPARSIL